MPTFGVAVKAIIYHPNLQKYLILKKSHIEDINPETYDFPGGRINFGESLETAVIREAKEETGLDVSPHRVFNAWTFPQPQKDFQLTGIDFLCTTDQDQITLSPEHSSYQWLSAKDIVNNPQFPTWLIKTIQKAEKI